MAQSWSIYAGLGWIARHLSSAERLIQHYLPQQTSTDTPKWRQATSISIVFILTVVAWTAFGSGSFRKTLSYWQALGSGPYTSPSLTLSMIVLPLILVALSIIIDFCNGKRTMNWFSFDITYTANDPIDTAKAAFFMNFALGKTIITAFIYQGF